MLKILRNTFASLLVRFASFNKKSPMPKFLRVDLKQPAEYGVTSLVAFGMPCKNADGSDYGIVYLVIRYIDYKNDIVEGDHLYLSLEETYEEAYEEYGVEPSDWQPLSPQEIDFIDSQIQ